MIAQTALTMVVHNEAPRLEALLYHLKPYFSQIAIGVQESTDGSLDIVRRYADVVIEDKVWGYGDKTFPRLLRSVTKPWSFRVDADEWPEDALLESLIAAATYCEERNLEGLWLPFRSWVEDVEWEVPHSHLRFWATRVGWPGTLHSRPMTDRTEFWPVGHILHRKSLDEHIKGYLGYYDAGRGNAGWDSHNLTMMDAACRGITERHGWDFVQKHEWWPQVRHIVYQDRDPAPQAEVVIEP